MGNKFGSPKKNESNMSPVRKQIRKEDEVDSMSPSVLKKELWKRGVAADEVLREKLKELTQSEPLEAEDANERRLSEMEIDTPDETPTELPVPVVKGQRTPRTTRSGAAGMTPKQSTTRRGRPPARTRSTTRRKSGSQKKPGVRKSVSASKRRYTKKRKTKQQPKEEEESEESDYDVEQLLDVRTSEASRGKSKKREFYVRWMGYSAEHDLWIDESNLAQHFSEYKMSDEVKDKLSDELGSMEEKN